MVVHLDAERHLGELGVEAELRILPDANRRVGLGRFAGDDGIPHPTSLVVGEAVLTVTLKQQVERVGEWVHTDAELAGDHPPALTGERRLARLCDIVEACPQLAGAHREPRCELHGGALVFEKREQEFVPVLGIVDNVFRGAVLDVLVEGGAEGGVLRGEREALVDVELGLPGADPNLLQM